VTDTATLLREQGLEVETVGEIIGDAPAAPLTPFVMPLVDDYPEVRFEPGIYFDLDEDTYHALPALSNGGVKKLAASPMIFYANCRWLNPNWEPPKQEDYFDTGSAYHCRLLEGREAFQQRYAVALDKADHPNALITLDDIKAAFPDGVKPRGKSKTEVIEHLRSLDATIETWDELKAEHEAANAGKCMIGAATHRQIEIAGRIIEQDQELSKLLEGGYPEVTLLWRCPRTGIPKKARVDKLHVDKMVDLKTLAGKREASIENAIRMDIANNRYAIQPSFYFEGAQEVRKVVRAHGASVIHGDAEQAAFAMKWAKHQQPDEWAWLYVLKGPATIARGLLFPRAGTTKMLADDICSMMSRRFRQFCEVYDTDPWLDRKPIYDLADEDLPPWATEI